MFSLINRNSKIKGTRYNGPSAFSLIFFLVGILIINGRADGKYPDQVGEVQIKSSMDGTFQKSLFFAPKSEKKVPLLVALHTWSSDWKNTYNVPLAEGCIERQWAFMHPDFRGPNKDPSACGSDLAVSDIIDAVKRAKENATDRLIAGTPDEIVEVIGQYANAGVNELIVPNFNMGATDKVNETYDFWMHDVLSQLS